MTSGCTSKKLAWFTKQGLFSNPDFLGVAENVLFDKVLDLIFLFATFCVYKCKREKRRPSLLFFFRFCCCCLFVCLLLFVCFVVVCLLFAVSLFFVCLFVCFSELWVTAVVTQCPISSSFRRHAYCIVGKDFPDLCAVERYLHCLTTDDSSSFDMD